MENRIIKLDKPIKETRVCKTCGRKKTFVFVWQEVGGGLWTRDYKPYLWLMKCPRCKDVSMIKEQDK